MSKIRKYFNDVYEIYVKHLLQIWTEVRITNQAENRLKTVERVIHERVTHERVKDRIILEKSMRNSHFDRFIFLAVQSIRTPTLI